MATYVFDLDGTIAESAPGIFASTRLTLAELGLAAPSDDELRSVIGPPLRETFARLIGDAPHDVEHAVRVYRGHYAGDGVAMSEPFPGMPAQLQALYANGHTLFVCTSKLETFAHAMLDRLALSALFAGVYGETASGEHKPELLARLVARHGIDPARAVMIGDRREDILAGRMNGLRTMGVLWGYGGLDELTEAGATAICASVDDLSAALAALAA